MNKELIEKLGYELVILPANPVKGWKQEVRIICPACKAIVLENCPTEKIAKESLHDLWLAAKVSQDGQYLCNCTWEEFNENSR